MKPTAFDIFSHRIRRFAYFSAIADLGIGSITAREISREGADENVILGRVASLRIITSLVLFLITP
jgi:O-antigen/teichoic acid export membrane protein